jgi:hypothetical protein
VVVGGAAQAIRTSASGAVVEIVVTVGIEVAGGDEVSTRCWGD